ncbi:hypothetical protein R6Q59_006867 [Mikania micrantha]
MNSNVTALRTQKIVFSRIGFAIQKGVAAQLVTRLPASLFICGNAIPRVCVHDILLDIISNCLNCYTDVECS